MRKPSKELRNLYSTYLKKRLRPENALEFAGGFILDLINAFGDKLDGDTPLAETSVQFSPESFLLQLNTLLGRYKDKGANSLDDVEKTILHDTHLMVATLVRTALHDGQSAKNGDGERYQISSETAADLDWLIENTG